VPRIACAAPELKRNESHAGFSTTVNNIDVFPQVRALVHPTGRYSKKCPQVEGHVLRLSARHAKLRREGYRKANAREGHDSFTPTVGQKDKGIG
jgi:hypothetical protein